MKKQEIEEFIEKFFDSFKKLDSEFRGTYFEKYYKENLKNFYPQLKFIFKELDKRIFTNKKLLEEIEIAYRKGEIIRKIMFDGELKGKVYFLNGEKKIELKPVELMDIFFHSLASLLEFYVSIFEKNKLFKINLLAKKLNFDSDFIGKICQKCNLEILFNKLAEEVNNKYKMKTKPMFSMIESKVRRSCFHNDYKYIKREGKAIILLENNTEEITLEEIIKLSLNTIAKLNIILIAPFWIYEKA